MLTFAAIAWHTFAVFAQPQWKSDQKQSKLGFSVTSMGINEVHGLFKNFEATILSSKEDFSDAVFSLTVDAASIDTDIKRRDNDLRSDNFFDVENLPQITFRSTSITKTGPNTYKLTGDLSMHGVTKVVSMDLLYKGTTQDPTTKALTSGFQVTGTLKRSDFNIGRGFMASMVGDEVNINADGAFISQYTNP
ncbi:hypothetical protein D770_20175 [Flammeovirgaceae bacterium 311]|nr:hypothetical protein D770_20175 [Flammeovirgaceae bacterium 311]